MIQLKTEGGELPAGPPGTCHVVRFKCLSPQFTCGACGREQYVGGRGEAVCIQCGRAPIGGERERVLDAPDYQHG